MRKIADKFPKMAARRSSSTAMMTWWMIMIWCWCSFTVPQVKAIWLNLPSSGVKCVSEEIHSNVVVLGDYSVIQFIGHDDHAMNHTVTVKVTSPFGNNLYNKENVTHGQFAFTTTEAGNYLACFTIEGTVPETEPISLSLEWRTGIATKDWDSVARKDKIEGVELELMKLEGLVDAIHENLIYLKSREAEMREVSEATNARVAWFSIISIGICIVVSGLQSWNLKSYFHKKKLI